MCLPQNWNCFQFSNPIWCGLVCNLDQYFNFISNSPSNILSYNIYERQITNIQMSQNSISQLSKMRFMKRDVGLHTERSFEAPAAPC